MATYYISTTGNDTTGDGSSGDPWATLSKAYTSASNSDTIIVASGTYSISNMAWDKNLTVIGAGMFLTILDGSDGDVRLYGNNATTCEWRDLQFYRCHGIYATLQVTANSALTLKRVMFNESLVDDSIGMAVVRVSGGVSSNSTYVTINSCIFKNCGGFNSVGSSFCIANSVNGGCIFLVTNSIFYSSLTVASKFSAFFSVLSSDAITVKNCLFKSTGGTIDGRQNTNGTWINSNNCWDGVAQIVGSGDILSDPLFIDVSNNNFNFRIGDGVMSPCVGAGAIT